MKIAKVIRVASESRAFANYHGLAVMRVGDSLRLDGKTNDGGFGDIHPLAAVNGQTTTTKVLAKVFGVAELAATGGPDPVTQSLADLFAALERCGDPDWPRSMLGLPYSLCIVRLAGEERLVALMLDLVPLGYAPLPFTDEQEWKAYLACAMDKRTALASSLAARAELLERVQFVHGDLNPENVFYNAATCDIQIIDFDCGVVLKTGRERPRTQGKQDDCMPPEVSNPRALNGVEPDRYTQAAERWSWMALFSYLILAASPTFFLRESSRVVVDAYAKAPERWPDIDQNGPLFTTEAVNQRIYQRMRASLSALPQEVQELFARTFDAGLDADGRPAPAEWLGALTGMQQPPVIELIAVDEDLVIEGDGITVVWRARNAAFVELSPGGRQPAQGSLALTLAQTTRIAISAFNAYGTDTAPGPVVRVARLPRIEMVPVPALPELPDFSTNSLLPSSEAPDLARHLPLPVLPTLVFPLASNGHTWSGSFPSLPDLPRLPQLPRLPAS